MEIFANYATLTVDYKLPLMHDEKMKLLNSILDKIEVINPLVVFTKREYSVMLAAMLHYEDIADEKDLTQEFYKLEEKINTKIG